MGWNLIVSEKAYAMDMIERRRAKRISMNVGALVDFGGKRGVFAGMLCDLSEAGAKIQLGRLPIPKRFVLSFDHFLTVRRCRLVWRGAGFAGVAFESPKGLVKNPSNH